MLTIQNPEWTDLREPILAVNDEETRLAASAIAYNNELSHAVGFAGLLNARPYSIRRANSCVAATAAWISIVRLMTSSSITAAAVRHAR